MYNTGAFQIAASVLGLGGSNRAHWPFKSEDSVSSSPTISHSESLLIFSQLLWGMFQGWSYPVRLDPLAPPHLWYPSSGGCPHWGLAPITSQSLLLFLMWPSLNIVSCERSVSVQVVFRVSCIACSCCFVCLLVGGGEYIYITCGRSVYIYIRTHIYTHWKVGLLLQRECALKKIFRHTTRDSLPIYTHVLDNIGYYKSLFCSYNNII